MKALKHPGEKNEENIEDLPHSSIGKNLTLWIGYPTKPMYRFNSVPKKIPSS